MKTFQAITALTLGALLLTGIGQQARAQKPSEKTVVISTSLTCDNCKKKIERDVAFEKGVKSIDANVETKKVTIRYDSDKTDEQKLVKAIEKLGYTAQVDEKCLVAEPDSKKGACCENAEKPDKK